MGDDSYWARPIHFMDRYLGPGDSRYYSTVRGIFDSFIYSQGIMQSPVVRKYANIPDDQIIMICVAMGYPDEDFPANKVVSRRRSVDEVATFHGF